MLGFTRCGWTRSRGSPSTLLENANLAHLEHGSCSKRTSRPTRALSSRPTFAARLPCSALAGQCRAKSYPRVPVTGGQTHLGARRGSTSHAPRPQRRPWTSAPRIEPRKGSSCNRFGNRRVLQWLRRRTPVGARRATPVFRSQSRLLGRIGPRHASSWVCLRILAWSTSRYTSAQHTPRTASEPLLLMRWVNSTPHGGFFLLG
jgi:hypothetical protein